MSFMRESLLKPHNYLIYLGIICLFFWLVDTYFKLFIMHAPSRMLWYSSAALLIISIGLFTRNSFLLTAMFCATVVNETLWSISFLSVIVFNKDHIGMTEYMFVPGFPKDRFFISLYHLILVPTSLLGLLIIKKISQWGWFGAFIFVTIVDLGAYFFPDPVENVNCIQGPTLFSCKLFFNNFYRIYDSVFSNLDKGWGVLMVTITFTLIIYIPANYLLFLIMKIYKRGKVKLPLN